MSGSNEEPSSRFKSALTGTMRAIAQDDELTVEFGAETPRVEPHRAKLPQVDHYLNEQVVAVSRGVADSFALRLARHDDKIHAQPAAPGPQCASRVRGGRTGPLRVASAPAPMPGMSKNLEAMLDDRYQKQGGCETARAPGCAS